MHDAGYKSALARRVCRYSDARPPRKTDGVLLESEIPPRMRGKVHHNPDGVLDFRITPTYAGKRSGRSGPIAYSQDHPRVCGEKEAYSHSKESIWGSPPRMRGKADVPVRIGPAVGITPAYAGKRRRFFGPCASPKDHPRVCGEKFGHVDTPPLLTGSPPRMRGKGSDPPLTLHHIGITPAYAGKSIFQRLAQITIWDHPRVCGEKTKKIP